MANDKVQIAITADAGGVTPGVDAAKAAVQGLGASVAASSAQMRASFTTVSASVREMGVQIRESVTMVGELREAAMAMGEAVIAAFAIEKVAEFAAHMGEAAEKVKHTAEIFGMTTPEVQGLQGAALQTGLGIDTLTRGMGILDKNMISAASGAGPAALAFKAVGVAAGDGKSQMETMLSIADKFKSMEDGPKKVALAMELFGKSGKEMIPFLNQGAQGIEKLDQKNQQYSAGIMVATGANKELSAFLSQANERGMALAESTNETKVAFQGLGNVMADALAPMLKDATDGLNRMIAAFITSYREGGAVAVAFKIVTGTVEYLGEVIGGLWQIWLEVWNAIKDLTTEVVGSLFQGIGVKIPTALQYMATTVNVARDEFVIFKDVVIMAVDIMVSSIRSLIGTLQLLGAIARDVLTLNWGAIAGDWNAGMSNLVKIVHETAVKVKASATEMGQAISAAMKGEALGGGKTEGVGEPAGIKDFDPNLTKAKKEKKPKAEKSRMSEWEQDITDQKTSFEMMQQQQGTHQEWSLQSDSDYWAKILARGDLSGRERLSVETKYLAALKSSNAQKLSDIEETAKKELDAADKNHAARIAILQKEASEVAAIFGAQSKQYETVQHQIIEQTRAASQEQNQIADTAAKGKIRLAQMDLQAENEAAKFRVEMGMTTKNQMLVQEQQFLAKKYALDNQALAIEQANAKDEPVKQAQLNVQKLEIEKQYQNALAQLQQRGALERTQIQRSALNNVMDDFSTGLGKMITGQQSFVASMRQMYSSLVNIAATAISSIIKNWLVAAITQKAITKSTQKEQVMADAKQAASGAYKAVVGIPYIGPILAPVAAATAFAGVAAFSAAGGWGEVPHDGAQTILHAKEMVLPADIATPLRDNLRGGGGSSGGGIGGKSGGGDNHYHYSPTVHGQMPFADQLNAHEEHMMSMFKRAARNGALRAA